MNLLPHMAARLFGAPLMIHRPKLEVILAVLGPRIGLAQSAVPANPITSRTAPTGSTGIAVLPIYGTLVRRTVGLEAESGMASYQGLATMLDAAVADPNVAAILLDIDSAGGESGGVFDLADRVAAAAKRKPVWALANDMAFSAAYAIGSAASRFIVTRTLKGPHRTFRSVSHYPGPEGGMCGIDFPPDEEVLVITTISADMLVTSSCHQPRFPLADYERAVSR